MSDPIRNIFFAHVREKSSHNEAQKITMREKWKWLERREMERDGGYSRNSL